MMRPVITPARCSLYPGDQGVELYEDFKYIDSDGFVYLIPRGFWCNGGSIPKPFQTLTFSPFDMDVIDIFIFHDWCYTTHCCSRSHADRELGLFISEYGSPVKAKAVEDAVRLFGASQWEHSNIDKVYLRKLRLQIQLSGRNPEFYGL